MPANLSAMTWWQYVQRIAAGQTQEQIARRVDVSTPTVGRWQASTPKPESVAGFARAYGRPVLEAFLAAGFLTEEEAHAQVTIQRYEDPSDETLLQLLAERLRRDREDVTGDDQHRPPMNQGADGPALTDRDRAVLMLVDQLDGDVTVDELRTTAEAISKDAGGGAPRAGAPAGAPTMSELEARRLRSEAAADALLARPTEKRAARRGTPDNPPDSTTGEGSQDEGGFEPA